MTLFKKILDFKYFEPFIIFVILINCVLIGVETYGTNPIIQTIQSFALFVFTFEIVVRYFSSSTTKEYFSG